MRTKQENVYRNQITGMLVLLFITHLVDITSACLATIARVIASA
jgi:hypothetical protein